MGNVGKNHETFVEWHQPQSTDGRFYLETGFLNGLDQRFGIAQVQTEQINPFVLAFVKRQIIL